MAISARNEREALRLAHAAGTDVGNRSAARAGRAAWNDADYDAACNANHAVLRATGYGWMIDGPAALAA
jgi:hypothetical protein